MHQLDDDKSEFYLHVDKKADINAFKNAIKPNEKIKWVKREQTEWASYKLVVAVLNALQHIKKNSKSFDRIILLSAQDYPIKDNSFIDCFFHTSPYSVFIEYFTIPSEKWQPHGGLYRINKYYLGSGISKKYFGKTINFLSSVFPVLKRKEFKEIIPFAGSQWWTIDGYTLNYIVDYVKKNPAFLKFHKYTFAADEVFFQSILLNAKDEVLLKSISNNNKRFYKWINTSNAHPDILMEKDLTEITKSNALFARKFDTEIDENILNKIDSGCLKDNKLISNKLDVLIVIPVGPQASISFTIDTINSIYYNIISTFKIIIIDDSQTGIGKQIKNHFPEVDLLVTEKNNGRLCGLYITLCTAFKHAIDNYDFNLLFKVDTDALIINKNPEAEALKLFNSDESIGMAGQYLLNYNGTKWDLSWPRDRLYTDMYSWKMVHHLFSNISLKKWYKKALHNGYITGESVFGGAYFFSAKCLKELDKEGLLPFKNFKNLKLEEDHLFSLLVKAIGYKLKDLSNGFLPFACSWRGLPAPPEELYEKGKKIIHSTRFWDTTNEEQIRNFFQQKRLA